MELAILSPEDQRFVTDHVDLANHTVASLRELIPDLVGTRWPTLKIAREATEKLRTAREGGETIDSCDPAALDEWVRVTDRCLAQIDRVRDGWGPAALRELAASVDLSEYPGLPTVSHLILSLMDEGEAIVRPMNERARARLAVAP